MLDSRRRGLGANGGGLEGLGHAGASSSGGLRAGSSGSGTPLDEDEFGIPRRASRTRNPLPPTSGPLFPPLPPKPPRHSPKNSPKTSRQTPTSKTSLSAPSAGTSTARGGIDLDDDALSSQRSGSERPPFASGSGTSLTPPPPTSDDIDMDAEHRDLDDDDDDDGEGEAGKPNDRDSNTTWEAYRSRRQIRAFPKSNINRTPIVKLEPQDNDHMDEREEDEETPKKSNSTRNGNTTTKKSLTVPIPDNSGGGGGDNASTGTSGGSDSAPLASGSGSGSGNGRQGRKRRGEELLLLDDHLLPEELRRLSSGSKKDKNPSPSKEEQLSQLTGEEEEEEQDGDDQPEQMDVDMDQPEEEAAEAGNEEEDEEDLPQDITRCVCQDEEGDPMMIQCDSCNVWQHGPCMGVWEDAEAPDNYYCEECRPDLHGPLKRWIRSKGRNIALFVPPTPEDLENLHNPHDKIPPSQSQRWLDPATKPHSKSGSRSNSRKERDAPSPILENNSHRRAVSRSLGGRGSQPAPSRAERMASKTAETRPPPAPLSSSSKKPSSHHGHSHGRKVSIDATSPNIRDRESRSPPRTAGAGIGMEPKKRSTMNSRDAAFEEEVKAAMEASRREMIEMQTEEVVPEEAVVDEELPILEKKHKGKRKREDDDMADSVGSVEPQSAPNSGKPKHPNQYTYRPKPPSFSNGSGNGNGTGAPAAAPSPARRGHQGGTPAPAPIPAPAQHEHGTRRAGALATTAVAQPFTTTNSVHTLSWHLPDHLTIYSDLLNSPNPIPLEVRSPRILPYLPRNHFHNQKYGPFSEERDSKTGKLILPPILPARVPTNQKGTHLEGPARVKFPVKRITTGEMRKRVKNMLDYVNRVRVEEGRRKERAEILGISVLPMLNGKGKGKGKGKSKDTKTEEGEYTAEVGDENARMVVGGEELTSNVLRQDVDTAETGHPLETEDVDLDMEGTDDVESEGAKISTRLGPTSQDLIEELSRELLAFQETWVLGGFATPIPPSIATFPSNGNGNGGGYTSSGLSKEIASDLEGEYISPPELAVPAPPTEADSAPTSAATTEMTTGLGFDMDQNPGNTVKQVGVNLAFSQPPIQEKTPEEAVVDVYREGNVSAVELGANGDQQVSIGGTI